MISCCFVFSIYGFTKLRLLLFFFFVFTVLKIPWDGI